MTGRTDLAAWLATIVAAATAGSACAQAAGDPKAGEDLFLDRCVTCHIPEGGGQGPSLKGVYGRKAGSAPAFAYSSAVRDSGWTWTGPTLDRFLTAPAKALPGTAMPIAVPNAKERADLIAFLGGKGAP
jgi:cytochrome c